MMGIDSAAIFVATMLTLVNHSPAEAFVAKEPTASASAAKAVYRAPFADGSTLSHRRVPSAVDSTTGLRMGLLDNVFGRFRGSDGDSDEDSDEEDFVRLSEMAEKSGLGPGPVVLLYQVPNGIDDEEVRDMLADGAPTATKQGIALARIASLADKTNKKSKNLVNMSLQNAIETVIKTPPEPYILEAGIPHMSMATPASVEGSPVAIFSGFTNSEMMESYNILGEELYKETASTYGKGQYLACARAVPNAMGKPLKQVLMEISGDHEDAISSRGQPKMPNGSGPTNGLAP